MRTFAPVPVRRDASQISRHGVSSILLSDAFDVDSSAIMVSPLVLIHPEKDPCRSHRSLSAFRLLTAGL